MEQAILGRSHRSKPGKARLAEIIDRSRAILGMPADWRLAIMAGSDTGAVEAAMWSLLGPLPVELLSFESFSSDWAKDATQQLKLDARVLEARYGELPDLQRIDWSRDVVLAWNGTTSGARIPIDAVPASHDGLVICDATSAAFAMELPWDRLDAVTWSWQKALGGEAGHGMLAIGPRAAKRLKEHTPKWPLPKIFRLTSQSAINEGLFKGETINTPSMLAVEDQLDALEWAQSIGGLRQLILRVEDNYRTLAQWVGQSSWASFLVEDEGCRSTTSVCLKLTDPSIASQPIERQKQFAGAIAALLEAEGVAYDIAAYRDAPPGLRIWCGPTIEASDVAQLTPWLDWAHQTVCRQHEIAG